MLGGSRSVHPVTLFLAGFFAVFMLAAGVAGASSQVPQTPLPGGCIPQFQVQLPVFGPAGSIPRVNTKQYPNLKVTMKEINQTVLPQVTIDTTTGCQDVISGWPALPPSVTFGPTRVWAYEIRAQQGNKLLGPANWPAVTLENTRYSSVNVNYVNQLPTFNPANAFGPPYGPALVQGLVTVDQTIHWADPFMTTMDYACMTTSPLPSACLEPFLGSVPTVAHLHGGETSPKFDGGPEQWFTPDGYTGKSFRTQGTKQIGQASYLYQNTQEPGTLWFHDHALGATRTNVYGGLAGFFFLRSPKQEPANLPTGAYEIEMAIQDRQFDTNSQLFFPDGTGASAAITNLNGTPPNPTVHPFWIPEFAGDVAVVNGAPWPYFNVEPRRYRLRLLNGSNARFYNLNFQGATVYQIGADDNYINTPALVSTVFIAPGERADVIVDFSGVPAQNITVTNDAPVPFPMGLVPGVDPGQLLMAQIMQFRVSGAPVADSSCNPALGQCTRPQPLVRLTDGNGNLSPGVKIDKKRQLVLKEVAGPGGPLEVLVNNTKWDGTQSPSIAYDFANGISEQPRVGATEIWEIINLTVDAHPMHTHLVQFQILNRESFNTDPVAGYPAVWAAAFGSGPAPLLPGCVAGSFCPGYGPPLDYKTKNADKALGGNPAIGPYLLHDATPPSPGESGFKDTAKAMPGQVLRLVVRWTPTDTPVVPNTSLAGSNFFPFDPTIAPGYVWHCHIIDHEDNEMMRPYSVRK